LQQVKVRNQPVGRQGLQRKSFLPPGGKKIEAKSPVFDPLGIAEQSLGAKKAHIFFLTCCSEGTPPP
jgi:hypothetical protein